MSKTNERLKHRWPNISGIIGFKQNENELQITQVEIHEDIGISQLNIQPAETCTCKLIQLSEQD